MTQERKLSLLVHGESKVGKTWLCDTTPVPRLVLDVEGGVQWTASRKVTWDPVQGPPPAADGTWDTCVVTVQDYSTLTVVYQWLATGQHQFVTVVVDSISEVQKRCKDALFGKSSLRIQDWGDLLTEMERLVRDVRDLLWHPTRPLTCVMLTAFTRESSGKFRPYVQGQLSTTMPYFLDVIGYLFVQQLDDGSTVRRLLITPHDKVVAGERVGGRLGAVVDRPNVSEMLDTLYAPVPQAPPPQAEASAEAPTPTEGI